MGSLMAKSVHDEQDDEARVDRLRLTFGDTRMGRPLRVHITHVIANSRFEYELDSCRLVRIFDTIEEQNNHM